MQLPDLYSQWSQARQNGEDRATDYTVRQNIGGALQGDSGALAAILKASPQMGMQLQDRAAGQQKAKLDQLGKFASAYVQTRDPMIWKQMHPLMVQAGAPADMPADLATPEDVDGSLKAAQSFAAMYGAGRAGETKVVGNALVGPDGRVIYQSPQRYLTAQGLIEVGPDGVRELRLGDGATQTATTQESDGRPVTISPDLDPATRAAIMANPDAFAALPGEGETVRVPGVPQGQRILPATSIAQEQQMALAREAAARAERAEARAAEAAARAAREAEIRRRFGTIPAGFRVNADGTALEAVPGGPKPAGAAASEDERKAAAWLAQATNAFANMQAALQSDPGADDPGFIETYSPSEEVGNRSRSATRQKYVQAAESLSESLLRAATGAGINEHEAKQKVYELTPRRGDSDAVKQQKMAAIPVYLQALRARAGRAVAQDAPADAPPSTHVGSGAAQQIKSHGRYRVGQVINVGGKQYRVTGGDMNDPDVEAL